MKKKVIFIICLILVLAIGLFVLTGCGNKTEENKVTNNNSQTTQKNESTANTVVNNTNNTTTSNNKKYEYTYKDGTLTQIVDEEGNPKQTDFVIDGIILIGNRHGYYDTDDTDTILNHFVKQGYKKEGINSSFYQNEHIEMYLDTKYNGSTSNVKVLITPHKTVEELEKMSISELTTLAEEKGAVLDYQTPDEENSKYIGDPYVNADYPEGKYDILFTYKGKLAYFINVNLTKEPTE
ncbi:MAG: hypothetical protein IJO27_03585 [Bacilli bacterium]|nr:hypothetical protein [Bacilli bacterium]